MQAARIQSQQKLPPHKVPVAYISRRFHDFSLRRLPYSAESLIELNAMLGRSFANLAERGIVCEAAHQSVAETAWRSVRGDCYVAVVNDRMVGTVTLHGPDPESNCEHYRNERVASLRQLAVDPAFQNRGIGKSLLGLAEFWAARRGYAELTLDTPDAATHLLRFYRQAGFRRVDTMQFSGRPHISAVMSKTPVAGCSLASWSTQLHQLSRFGSRM